MTDIHGPTDNGFAMAVGRINFGQNLEGVPLGGAGALHMAGEAKREIERLTERVRVLREALLDAVTRMDRARNVLTDGNPRPECNWGMLDTERARAALKATQ